MEMKTGTLPRTIIFTPLRDWLPFAFAVCYKISILTGTPGKNKTGEHFSK
ncbi:MAG: hypothetical protein H6557_03445 [Lewinellaceae bacterium]|nr:hypothetical protein [Phaeodactylibacter sp.]MCB9035651.1 hypothetical protein [Lewinellaceae bacterium]